MSWKPEVIADDSGKWSSNALRFATEAEALGYAKDLHARWTMVREYRAVESDDDVTHSWDTTAPERPVRPRAPADQQFGVEVIKAEDIGPMLNRMLAMSKLKADELLADWRYEVANGDTMLGFDEWLSHRRERDANA